MLDAVIKTGVRDNRMFVSLSGDWTLATLSALHVPFSRIERHLRDLARGDPGWDLQGITRLDSAGAFLIWRAWDNKWPASLSVSVHQRSALERLASISHDKAASAKKRIRYLWLIVLGQGVLAAGKNVHDVLVLVGQLVLDMAYLFAHPAEIPWREFSANIYKSGAQALPVTALVGFLIGVVLSFLSALQLKTFGADIYIVNLLGVSIIRELGPVIVAVLVAGRSGSAMTAQIGVMRVTQEIDALATMGISRSLRLVLPKVAALSVAMPLLVLWCSTAGLVGGMVSANLEMGLDYRYFIEALPRVVPISNLWIGIGKGFVFGMLIALMACHFGLKVRPNTESLSSKTTTSVVTAITLVIIFDAIIAVMTRHLGMPGGG